MLVHEAKRVLGLHPDEPLHRKTIDTAYRRACRLYHPDSSVCRSHTHKDSVGKHMNQLAEARQILLSMQSGVSDSESIDSLWNEEKQEWIRLGSDVLTSGCLWDETKEIPIQQILLHVIHSKFVGALLERMYTKVQK